VVCIDATIRYLALRHALQRPFMIEWIERAAVSAQAACERNERWKSTYTRYAHGV